MKTVRINKAVLREAVVKNQGQHRAQFEKAFEGYRQECMELLEKHLQALKADKRHIVIFMERPPEDHTDDYKRIVSMLEMSVDEVVELTELEFSQFVLDDWEWKERWTASNSKYMAARI